MFCWFLLYGQVDQLLINITYWCFQTSVWCWRRLLRVPCTARRSSQSILKEINPDYSSEGLMLKLKLQYFGHLTQRANSLEKPWCWERLEAGGEGTTGDEMVGRHHRLNGHEFQQARGDSEGREAWCAAVRGVTKSWIRLSNWTTKALCRMLLLLLSRFSRVQLCAAT